MKGVRDHHYRDFSAYIDFNRLCNPDDTFYFCPDGGSSFVKGDQNTVKCFVNIDARNKKNVCPKEPELLKLAVDGKRLVNFHIKLWAFDIYKGLLFPHEIIKELLDLPEWVCEALINQIEKLERNDDGTLI